MTAGSEYSLVEKPFLDQLAVLGWKVLEGHKHDPSLTERQDFTGSILEDRLRGALTKINLGPNGLPWLEDARLSEAVGELTRFWPGNLIEVNERMTELLVTGASISGLPEWDHGRNQQVRYIDFEHPENNDFLAVSQFRIDEPGGQSKKFIAPDIVLFVNGIPLVVIECKSPNVVNPMAEGIRQLRRYANQRGSGVPEGNERLFWTNQLVIATFGDHARVGTFTSAPEHFSEWKDTYPRSRDSVAKALGKGIESLSGQEVLVAGVLDRSTLLAIVRNFILFTVVDGKKIKIVARYQQYRAVGKSIARLRTGKTRINDGELDRRGGLIWHTQGSGKSLTMVFLVRAMRSDPRLRSFKVVVITDRTDLEKQLAATAALSGEAVQVVRRSRKLKKVLAEHGPGLVFAMIQKYRDADVVPPDGLEGEKASKPLGVLNRDESIVILVDEAHRSQQSTLHANLMAALPNAAKVGFTGTPIFSEAKTKTTSIFGEPIDTYTIRQAERDEAVVPILYEGRTVTGRVEGATDLDQLFEDMFVHQSPDEVESLKKRYATAGAVLEAPALIAAKATSMMWHYLSTVFPGGFKAQVAATSRLAAIRYRHALGVARDEFVREVECLPQHIVEGLEDSTIDIDTLSRRDQILARSRSHLDLIRALEFVPVISGEHNDDPTWDVWTDKAKQDSAIASFKKPLGPGGPRSSPVAFLIVRTMLLTGFDAPVEQVLYLDRFIQDAELLQAIARVNRTAKGKSVGLLVDYYGVGAHLQSALRAYAPEDEDDVIGVVTSIVDELPKLADRHARVVSVFSSAGIDRVETDEDIEVCVEVLADEPTRIRFEVLLKSFLTTLDSILPRPEALPYVKDAKRLGAIQKVARRRYRQDEAGEFDASLYGEKVRELIDEHVLALDIESKIPPVSITDPDFIAKVNGLVSDRAKASEMEHALRFHIRKKFDEDPVRYQKLSVRLDEILKSLGENWDQLCFQLEQLLQEARENIDDDSPHADPFVARVYRLLEQRQSASVESSGEPRLELLDLASEIVRMIAKSAGKVRFWQNLLAQEELRRELRVALDDSDLYLFEEQEPLADALLDLASANRDLVANRDAGDRFA